MTNPWSLDCLNNVEVQFEATSVPMMGREKIAHVALGIVNSGAAIHKEMSRIYHSPFRGPTLDETRVTGGQNCPFERGDRISTIPRIIGLPAFVRMSHMAEGFSASVVSQLMSEIKVLECHQMTASRYSGGNSSPLRGEVRHTDADTSASS